MRRGNGSGKDVFQVRRLYAEDDARLFLGQAAFIEPLFDRFLDPILFRIFRSVERRPDKLNEIPFLPLDLR